MTQVSNSLLSALIGYYRRLEADPGQAVAPFGFSREKIHFQIVLEADGSLAGLEDIRESNARGKPIPQLMLVPDGGGRSGNAVKPFFCWDNTGYVLGFDNKGKPERAARMFAAFRELHLSMRGSVGADPGFGALCRFLEQWNPSQAQALPGCADASGLNIVFRLRAHEAFVHQSERVQRAWLSRAGVDSERHVIRAPSLISGENDDLARLHPLIGGVAQANTTGAAIVSFNLAAFESYGKTQSYNSPVGRRDAFRYTTALNRLLADNTRRVRLGDATVVFWAESPEAGDAESVFAELFGEVPKADAAESGKTADRLRGFLRAARDGRIASEVRVPESGFYVLGLAPNASRINVRFWLASTVAEFAERLARHEADLDMIGAKDGRPPLVIRRLLLETAREPKDIAPRLAGEMARSVLGGLPYPRTLLSAVIRRVRADGDVNHRRAAIVKAYLIRNLKQEVPVALKKDHPDTAYHLGRLFAALEKTQEDATEGRLNSTIKDRYFGAASSTPASVFPQLLRLHQHHMNKLDNVGQRVRREQLVGEICSHIDRFALHLPLEKQGLFQIAYYHQRQDFFTKKDDTDKGAENA